MKHVLRVVNALAAVVIVVALVVLLCATFTPAGGGAHHWRVRHPAHAYRQYGTGYSRAFAGGGAADGPG